MSEILNQRHTFDLIQVDLARNREGALAIQASQEERVRFLVDGIFERQDNICESCIVRNLQGLQGLEYHLLSLKNEQFEHQRVHRPIMIRPQAEQPRQAQPAAFGSRQNPRQVQPASAALRVNFEFVVPRSNISQSRAANQVTQTNPQQTQNPAARFNSSRDRRRD